MIEMLKDGGKILSSGQVIIREFPPHKRTICFRDKFYRVALPRLTFAVSGDITHVFVGGISHPEEMKIFKHDGMEWFGSDPLVPWHFYNIRYQNGGVCMGFNWARNGLGGSKSIDYFWSSDFNRSMPSSFFMRPIFVKGRLLPIVNLRQWARLTRKDPDLQNKLDVDDYIQDSTYKFRFFFEKSTYNQNHFNFYFKMDKSISIPLSNKPLRSSRSKLSGAINLISL